MKRKSITVKEVLSGEALESVEKEIQISKKELEKMEEKKEKITNIENIIKFLKKKIEALEVVEDEEESKEEKEPIYKNIKELTKDEIKKEIESTRAEIGRYCKIGDYLFIRERIDNKKNVISVYTENQGDLTELNCIEDRTFKECKKWLIDHIKSIRIMY